MEGTNNKIKTMKRQAYGFRDIEFLKLKILAIHEPRYALVRAKPTASGRATRRGSERCVVHSSTSGIGSVFQGGPDGQEGGAYARLAKPVPWEVGVQVPRGGHTEVPSKVFYERLRRENGVILRELCRQRRIELMEGHAMPDHVHLCLSTPPK
jgi:hypothetical protein